MESVFRSSFSEDIFHNKYGKVFPFWSELCQNLAQEVMGGLVEEDLIYYAGLYMKNMLFIPGGRYLYYAGRPKSFYNNCFLLRAEEDTREDWANLSWKAENCLMTGGGIGIDYSRYREKGRELKSTGGIASGPVPKMYMINEIGRNVMQGGSRRSAIYASLNWKHPDIADFLIAKNWKDMPIPGTDISIWDARNTDFNFSAPLDMTNISLNYDDKWLNKKNRHRDKTFLKNIVQACSTGEPGFSFNFGDKQNETLRNACTEVVSEDDSDVCNLGSINMSRIIDLEEFIDVVKISTIFLLCGSIKGDVPYKKIRKVREKNRRLGLGLMGIHEWLLKRGYSYEVVSELKKWLSYYQNVSDTVSNTTAHYLSVSSPVAVRAIAPTGTIGLIAGTTTGIEPIYATAYKRRYLRNGTDWHYQFVVDSTAKTIINEIGVDNPDDLETSLSLAANPEKRIKFQADIQEYVDQSISSTINLPSRGSLYNNLSTDKEIAALISKYAPRLRGLTIYPDGARGGQPLSMLPYKEVIKQEGVEFKEHDICDISGKGGFCGV